MTDDDVKFDLLVIDLFLAEIYKYFIFCLLKDDTAPD